jgi:outer membrane protein OmpA-like peptidoglycan-associated protein
MFDLISRNKRTRKDEAEKPFWISFSDMMTALMVLFLVAMSVNLLAITNKISAAQQKKDDREKEINQLMSEILKEAEKSFPGIVVRGHKIDFGEQANFQTNSHYLSSEQERLLRSFVPKILTIVRNPLGEKWIKRIVVEGFADQRGTYLHNLNLSIQRSERVLCALLASPDTGETPLSIEDRLLIRKLFLVGGSSYNSLKQSLAESRRIELRLEFLELDEDKPRSSNMSLDENQPCPLD